MKVKIKSFNGELPDYLSKNGEYDLFHDKIHGIDFYSILDKNMNIKNICLEHCDHLNGGSWEVLE